MHKKKIKILFASIQDANDILAWSGTINSLYKILSKTFDVETVRVYSRFALIVRKVLNILHFNVLAVKAYVRLLSIKFDLISMNKKCDYIFAPISSEFLSYSRLNKKIIYLTDSTYNCMFDYYINNLDKDLRVFYDMVEKSSLQKSWHVITANNWAYNDMINHYSVDKNKIDILKFGPNIQDEKFNKLRYLTNDINILLVGVEYYRKGVDVAIDTIIYLNDIDSKHNYFLHIVGLSEKDIPNINSSRFIKYYGKLKKNNRKELDTMLDLYRKSNVFFLPTRAECAGIVFSESSMYALPIVTRNTGGVSDYVINNLNGFCLDDNSTAIDFANKIYEICNDDNLYSRLQISAREYYEKELNWNIWIEKFKELINDK